MVTRKEHGTYRGVYWNAERARWEQRISIDGTRYLFSAKKATDVADKVRQARNRAESGVLPDAARQTVKAYLDWWVKYELPRSVAPSTVVTYTNVLNLYVIPHIGRRQLGKLSADDVTRMLNKLEAQGVSPNTQRAARSVLRRALRRAQQKQAISINAAAIADGVKVRQTIGRTLTPEQARILLDHVHDHRLGAAWAVALALGLRRGELLALAWPDIDLERGTLTVNANLTRLPTGLVRGEPKTPQSRRTVHLPAPLIDALRRHKVQQAAERLIAGPEWVEMPLGVDLVFRTPFGTALDPDNFRNLTYKVTAEAGAEWEDDPDNSGKLRIKDGTGLGRWSPHSLRHSSASLLLAQGVPLKLISELLGHSSIRVTSDVYSHVLEPLKRDVADAMESALWG